MPSKGTQKFMDGLSGLFGKKETPQEKMRSEQNKLAADRSREENMIFKLQGINIHDPANKLTAEYIKSKNYDSIIRYAISELKNPPIITQDIELLDSYVEYTISALDAAIKEGLETAAEWASIGLHSSINNLRTEVPGIDAEFADDLMESRLQYAENLKNIIRVSIEYDKMKLAMDRQKKRLERQNEKLDALKAECKAYQDTPEGGVAAEEIKQYAGNTAMMSPAAKAFQDKLYELHRMRAQVLQTGMDIDAKNVDIQNKSSQIENLRNQLATPPAVSDPQLHERIKRANEEYLSKILRQLNTANEGMKEFDQFLSKLSSMHDHEVFAYMATQAKNEMDRLEIEELQEQQRKKEVLAKMRKTQQEKDMLRLQNLKLEQELREEYEKLEAVNEEVEDEFEEEEQVEEIFIME